MTGDPRTVDDLRHAFEHPPVVPDPGLVDLADAHQTARHRQRRAAATIAAAGLVGAAVVALVVASPWTTTTTAPVVPARSPDTPSGQEELAECNPGEFTRGETLGPQSSDGVSWLTTFTYEGHVCEFHRAPNVVSDDGADLRLTWVNDDGDGWAHGWSPVQVIPGRLFELVAVADETPCYGTAGTPSKVHTLHSLVWRGDTLDLGGMRVWSCDGEVFLEARVASSPPVDAWTAFQPIYGFDAEQPPPPPPVNPATAPDCDPWQFDHERDFGPRETATGQAWMLRYHNHGDGCVIRDEPRATDGQKRLTSARWLHEGTRGWAPVVVEAGDVVQLMAITEVQACGTPDHVIDGFLVEFGDGALGTWTFDMPSCDGAIWFQLSAGVRTSDAYWFNWNDQNPTPAAVS